MNPDEYAACRDHLVQYEGNYPYMYNDTDKPPVPTLYIGCALFTEADARSVGDQPAVDAWHLLRTLPGGMAPGWYAAHCAWRGDPDRMEALFRQRFQADETTVMLQIPDWADIPKAAKIVVMDVVWQNGSNLRSKWPHFLAAILAGDWATAAKESGDAGPEFASRNAERVRLLLSLT